MFYCDASTIIQFFFTMTSFLPLHISESDHTMDHDQTDGIAINVTSSSIITFLVVQS